MKTMLMAVMAVAVAVTFSAPSFAEEGGKKKPKEGHVVVYGDQEKKSGKGSKADDTFAEKKEKPTK